MIKKSILIENKSSINCKNLQLIIKSETREASIPIEDIGFLVIDNPEVYISITALNLLVENNASVIICNKTHLPNGMFLNLNSHHVQHEIFKNQMKAS
ncbi:MAG: CRISPR-associated endonuclease Cas1, partial [Bacteroidetes bacterium]|nr:CRISPR-associated endonuclease Cas1 [Bacteroidota bacterium]